MKIVVMRVECPIEDEATQADAQALANYLSAQILTMDVSPRPQLLGKIYGKVTEVNLQTAER